MRAFRRELGEFLRAEGAAVLLQDSGKPHNLLVTTGGWRANDRGGDRANAPEPMPSLFVAHEHYALLHRLATRPEPAKTKVEVEITNKFIPGPITVYNTVGEIPGERADEFVVVGAHLDSWDLAQGTTDNGTGSCIVLETARLLARSGVKPKRTIRFVLFTGEEQGLYGSKAYCRPAQGRDGQDVGRPGPRHRDGQGARVRAPGSGGDQADHGQGTRVTQEPRV